MDIMKKKGILSNGDTLSIIEKGDCEILKNTPRHMSILFKGKTLNGVYGFVKMEKDKWLLIPSK